MLDGLQRWRYQGRRHQRGLLLQHRTAAALIGTALGAILLVLTVALWPPPRRTNNVVLPEIPRPTLTVAPTGSPSASATPSTDGSAGTSVPPAPPPLPSESAEPPTPANPAPKPAAPKPAAPPTIPIRAFEAESAANMLFGHAHIRNVPEASSGQVIGFIGTNDAGSSGTLRISGLNVPAAGMYTLTIFYVSGDSRPARLRINGATATVDFPSTGNWDTVGSLTTRVNLAAGNNSLTIDNPDEWAPDIDRVVLSN